MPENLLETGPLPEGTFIATKKWVEEQRAKGLGFSAGPEFFYQNELCQVVDQESYNAGLDLKKLGGAVDVRNKGRE